MLLWLAQILQRNSDQNSLSSPSGTLAVSRRYPALMCWVTLGRPFGTSSPRLRASAVRLGFRADPLHSVLY
jgi:hypothetical protein